MKMRCSFYMLGMMSSYQIGLVVSYKTALCNAAPGLVLWIILCRHIICIRVLFHDTPHKERYGLWDPGLTGCGLYGVPEEILVYTPR